MPRRAIRPGSRTLPLRFVPKGHPLAPLPTPESALWSGRRAGALLVGGESWRAGAGGGRVGWAKGPRSLATRAACGLARPRAGGGLGAAAKARARRVPWCSGPYNQGGKGGSIDGRLRVRLVRKPEELQGSFNWQPPRPRQGTEVSWVREGKPAVFPPCAPLLLLLGRGRS